MRNRNLMESTVTKNMGGYRKGKRRYSNLDGSTTNTLVQETYNEVEGAPNNRTVIQEPVATVDYNVNTTEPVTIDSREALLSQDNIIPREEKTIGDVPIVEDPRSPEVVVTTRPAQATKKGMSEDTKNLLFFSGVVFIGVGAIWLIATYGNKLPIKG